MQDYQWLPTGIRQGMATNAYIYAGSTNMQEAAFIFYAVAAPRLFLNSLKDLWLPDHQDSPGTMADHDWFSYNVTSVQQDLWSCSESSSEPWQYNWGLRQWKYMHVVLVPSQESMSRLTDCTGHGFYLTAPGPYIPIQSVSLSLCFKHNICFSGILLFKAVML